MKHALALLALAPPTGCATIQGGFTSEHMLDARTFGPNMLEVLDQHDESVLRDPELVAVEKEQSIRGAEIAREAILSAMGVER